MINGLAKELPAADLRWDRCCSVALANAGLGPLPNRMDRGGAVHAGAGDRVR